MNRLMKLLNKYQLVIGILIINFVLLIKHVRTFYVLELLNSLAFQGLFILLALCCFLVYKRLWIGLSSTLVAVYLLAAQIPMGSYYQTENGNFKLVHFNVLKLNHHFGEITQYAQNSQADLLSFNEVTPEWKKKLEDSLSSSYPYHVCQLAENNSFGIAVYSKYPLENVQIKYWGRYDIPSIVCTVSTPGKDINLVAAHTIPPMRQDLYTVRNHHLAEIGRYFSSVKGTKLLVGDLNTVSWSESLENLKNNSQLEDSRKAWQPTFPSTHWLMSIPIDHIFHSKDLRCVKFNVIESHTSDHHGIEGEFLI